MIIDEFDLGKCEWKPVDWDYLRLDTYRNATLTLNDGRRFPFHVNVIRNDATSMFPEITGSIGNQLSEYNVQAIDCCGQSKNSFLLAAASVNSFFDKYRFQYDPIKKVIYNPPKAVIVYWKDGTKTVVKCSENDTWDPEKGLAMAIVKKKFGNRGSYNNILKKHLPDESE